MTKDKGAAEKKRESKKVALDEKEWAELKDKAAKADAHWDRILRMTADFENTKKRLEKRNQDLVKFANEKLVLDVLEVSDDLERALQSLDKDHDITHIKQGLELVNNKFHGILEKNGVQAIKAEGQAFDPHLHEALGEVVDPDIDEGHVAQVIQKGYTLNGRLARPSRVRIAKRS